MSLQAKKKQRTPNMAAKGFVTSPESVLDRKGLDHVNMEHQVLSILRAASLCEDYRLHRQAV